MNVIFLTLTCITDYPCHGLHPVHQCRGQPGEASRFATTLCLFRGTKTGHSNLSGPKDMNTQRLFLYIIIETPVNELPSSLLWILKNQWAARITATVTPPALSKGTKVKTEKKN